MEYVLDLTGKQIMPEQLHAELKARIGASYVGISTYGADRPISIWIVDNPVEKLDDLAAMIEDVAALYQPVEWLPEKTMGERIAELQARVEALEAKVP